MVDVRIEQISGVGPEAAASLRNAGFRTLEGVAYSYGPRVCSVDSVDSAIFFNAQEKVAEVATANDPKKALEQRNYYCVGCEPDKYTGVPKWPTEEGCLSHMQNCIEAQGVI
jgi:hypothetical protein